MEQVVLAQFGINDIITLLNAAGTVFDTAEIRLFTNTPALRAPMLLADFVEPTFTGYAPAVQALTNVRIVFGPEGQEFFSYLPVVFTCSGGVPADTVNGWMLCNHAAPHQVLCAAYFENPRPITMVGATVTVQVGVGIPAVIAPNSLPF